MGLEHSSFPIDNTGNEMVFLRVYVLGNLICCTINTPLVKAADVYIGERQFVMFSFQLRAWGERKEETILEETILTMLEETILGRHTKGRLFDRE